MPGLTIDTRSVEDHDSLCPAAAPVGESLTGSGVLCRITGNLVTTGENPSSLRAYCWNQLACATAATTDGEKVEHGYQACPAWRYNRDAELEAKADKKQFVTQAST